MNAGKSKPRIGKITGSEKPRRRDGHGGNFAGKAPAVWPEKQSLFNPIPAEAKKTLDKFPEILEKVWPLKKRHRDQLPRDIAELSEKLTSNRKDLEKNYWSRPENISAYLYYFLPWNLLRLLSLLPALPLGFPEKTETRECPVIYDAGSGPLTMAIAMWLAKPEWRNVPLKILAVDKAKKPLELGKRILGEVMRGEDGKAWNVATANGSIFALAELAKKQEDFAKSHPFLICASNILNELSLPASFQKSQPASLEELLEQLKEEPEKEEEKFYALLDSWEPLLRKGKVLFVEPGTRLGGASIMQARKAAKLFHLYPLSPCAHSRNCPLLGEFSRSSSAYQKNWCHFTFPAREVPAWLASLSRESGLEKSSLSLSFALFGHNGTLCPEKPTRIPARVISGAFKIPELHGLGRYACSEKGLLLLENSGSLQRGMLTEADLPDKPQRDIKSGAWRIPQPEQRESFQKKKTGDAKRNCQAQNAFTEE